MSAAPSFAPIVRRVRDGGVIFNNNRYEDEALMLYSGSDVLLDMEVDVRSEKRCLRVYDVWENEICLIELDDDVESIKEASHGER
jgi:hypothetical protein